MIVLKSWPSPARNSVFASPNSHRHRVPEEHHAVSELISRPPDEPQRILWIRVDSIGDNVLASSMLPHVRQKFPFAEITVLCHDHVAELYETCPFIDRIIP